jgi:hypothetical protein
MEREKIEGSSTSPGGPQERRCTETAKNACNLIRQEHHFLEGGKARFLLGGCGLRSEPARNR